MIFTPGELYPAGAARVTPEKHFHISPLVQQGPLTHYVNEHDLNFDLTLLKAVLKSVQ